MKKRIKVKGHYRSVERDEEGKFVKVEKWSSKSDSSCDSHGFSKDEEDR